MCFFVFRLAPVWPLIGPFRSAFACAFRVFLCVYALSVYLARAESCLCLPCGSRVLLSLCCLLIAFVVSFGFTFSLPFWLPQVCVHFLFLLVSVCCFNFSLFIVFVFLFIFILLFVLLLVVMLFLAFVCSLFIRPALTSFAFSLPIVVWH